MYTLREWQQLVKPEAELIVNASRRDGSDGWTRWPIGYQYKFSDYNGPLEPLMVGPHDRLVLCAINAHTDAGRRPRPINRNSIVATLSSRGIPNTFITDYFKDLPAYKFIISPEGNGIDTHRTYEALMAGCIPIVEDDPLIRRKYGGCPILYTRDYSEITLAYLNEKYSAMIDEPYNFSSLYLSSYSPHEQKTIMESGNFWCAKFGTRLWHP